MRRALLTLLTLVMATSAGGAALADAPPQWRRIEDGEHSIVLLDTANIRRDGDRVIVNAALIPQKAADYKGGKAVMITTTESFDCKAHTRASTRVTLYDVTGYVYNDAVIDNPVPRDIIKDSNADQAWHAVCDKDGLPKGPVVTDLMAERAAWLATQ